MQMISIRFYMSFIFYYTEQTFGLSSGHGFLTGKVKSAGLDHDGSDTQLDLGNLHLATKHLPLQLAAYSHRHCLQCLIQVV